MKNNRITHPIIFHLVLIKVFLSTSLGNTYDRLIPSLESNIINEVIESNIELFPNSEEIHKHIFSAKNTSRSYLDHQLSLSYSRIQHHAELTILVLGPKDILSTSKELYAHINSSNFDFNNKAIDILGMYLQIEQSSINIDELFQEVRNTEYQINHLEYGNPELVPLIRKLSNLYKILSYHPSEKATTFLTKRLYNNFWDQKLKSKNWMYSERLRESDLQLTGKIEKHLAINMILHFLERSPTTSSIDELHKFITSKDHHDYLRYKIKLIRHSTTKIYKNIIYPENYTEKIILDHNKHAYQTIIKNREQWELLRCRTFYWYSKRNNNTNIIKNFDNIIDKELTSKSFCP